MASGTAEGIRDTSCKPALPFSAMTAKELLRERIERLTEEEAVQALRLLDREADPLTALLDDAPLGDIRRLADISPPEWRLRVGDWRVRFTRDATTRTVLILRVLPRGSAYRT